MTEGKPNNQLEGRKPSNRSDCFDGFDLTAVGLLPLKRAGQGRRTVAQPERAAGDLSGRRPPKRWPGRGWAARSKTASEAVEPPSAASEAVRQPLLRLSSRRRKGRPGRAAWPPSSACWWGVCFASPRAAQFAVPQVRAPGTPSVAPSPPAPALPALHTFLSPFSSPFSLSLSPSLPFSAGSAASYHSY